MFKEIKYWFIRPTLEEKARKELLEAHRSFMEASSAIEYSLAMQQYNQAVIDRLEAYLKVKK